MPGLRRVERGLLARLRTMTAGDWAALPDSGAAEGLPPRLERAGKQCRSLEEFFQLAKPRHWTQARLRRLLVWAFLGLTRADRPDAPPYLRVLGFNARGQELLKAMKAQAALPILTKPAHARELAEPGGGCSPWRPDAPICMTCACRRSPPRGGSGPPGRYGCEEGDRWKDEWEGVRLLGAPPWSCQRCWSCCLRRGSGTGP